MQATHLEGGLDLVGGTGQAKPPAQGPQVSDDASEPEHGDNRRRIAQPLDRHQGQQRS